MASIKIKTPTKSWEPKQGVIYNDVITKEVKSRVANIVLGELSVSAKIAIEREISILATFFQRVVARTPRDEIYLNEKGYEHTPDESICQDDWYITDGKKKITSKEMRDKNPNLFWSPNDLTSVNIIKKLLKNSFQFDGNSQFTIGNNNPHFKILEEGCDLWEKDSKHPASSISLNKRPHGVKNKHSIQAPVGMWRISLAELEVMRNSTALSPLTSRYRAQYGRTETKPPSKKKLAEFARLLASKGDITYKDIVRYIEEY